ncbi:putative ROK-family transcriptional regulator [Alloactinosynnema sp. L-07]|uniref:ROK family transcriptional regulator n=1 Tax=Alloactinosynnema sp. L-07 TaxID=1653480 RepID=UPI00065EFD5E|nr:ROK family transcriptional regulator [Alloactinosynnema sp. L-07]CRK56494.1 putative ROK-family transcriptional regulator [Alloactinosynnema sp. L-07]
MSEPTPGTPSTLRAINDRAALEVLLARGPLTRTELASITGISKPTASQLLSRLQESGLVVLEGIRQGRPGRTAEFYGVNPSAAHVAAVDVTAARIDVRVAELTGRVIGEHRLPTPGRAAGDLVGRMSAAISGACEPAGIAVSALNRVVIGVPGAIDPATGLLGFAAHLPGWRVPSLVETLGDGLGVRVEVENDVNLAAHAEQSNGVARSADSFAVLWVADGIGMALVIGGRLHRGATGGAGEVGYLPVPGAPTAREVGRNANHGLQALVGGPAVHKILRSYGFRGAEPAVAVRVAADALRPGGSADRAEQAESALREVAARVAVGLSSVVAVVDPALLVLTGEVMHAGGERLRAFVQAELHATVRARTPVLLSTLSAQPVLEGALTLALRQTQDELFAATLP